MADEKNIGLFMDFENVVRGVEGATRHGSGEGGFDVQLILDRLLETGKIIVKKSYADWARYRAHKQALHEAGFELIEIPKKRTAGKNSADIRMVVDVMDLSSAKEHVDTFCLVTGDSDFSPLVSKLKENNKSVIGVGAKETVATLLATNCDTFLYYEDLVKDREMRQKRRSDRSKKLSRLEAEAVGHVTDALTALVRDGKETIWASMIKQTIKRKNPQFSETFYDFDSFSSLLRFAEDTGVLRLEEDPKAGGYIVRSIER